jgi:hypothetical protein
VAERVEGVRGGGEEEEMAEVVMEAAGKEAERVEGATAVVARMAARVAATKEAEADVVACSLAPLADTAAAAARAAARRAAGMEAVVPAAIQECLKNWHTVLAGTPVAELVAIEACLKHSSRRKKEAMGWEGGVVGREAACRAAASRS